VNSELVLTVADDTVTESIKQLTFPPSLLSKEATTTVGLLAYDNVKVIVPLVASLKETVPDSMLIDIN